MPAGAPRDRFPPESTGQVVVDGIGPAVRRDLKYGADWIKLMATGGAGDVLSDFNTQELSGEQMAKAVEIAHRAHRKVMAHALGAEGVGAAVRAGVDSIEHGTIVPRQNASRSWNQQLTQRSVTHYKRAPLWSRF